MKKTVRPALLLTAVLSLIFLTASCGTQKKAITESTAISEEETTSEKVQTVSESEKIETYNVICGSFKLLSNAQTLWSSLSDEGYHPILVINPETKTYRVVLATFRDKAEAVSAREDFKKKHSGDPDFQKSWILKLIK